MKFGILCSGNLGHILLKQLYTFYNIKFVFTDIHSNEILDFCKEHEILSCYYNPRLNKAKEFIEINRLSEDIDVIISINYTYLVDKSLIEIPKKCIFNIHGSLLPKYRGRTPHVWSIINNEEYTGITAHLIDEGCDTGDIIDQIQIEIDQDDTGYSILKKYEREYLPLINKVINRIQNNSLNPFPQDCQKASYFGKRTPDDGQINWNWQKERIRNWVRAQTFPYPGAFCFFKSEKIIIDEVKFVDFSYSWDDHNGCILCINPLIVKCPNGCIEIVSVRNKIESELTLKSILV